MTTARDKSKTKQSSTLEKDLDAEASADNKDQTEVSQTRDSTGEGNSNDDESFDSNKMRKYLRRNKALERYMIVPLRRGDLGSQKLQPTLPRKIRNIFIRRRVMNPSTKRSNPKGKIRMQVKIALILTIVVTRETMIPLETTKKK